MANVKKLKVNNTEYTIVDSTALHSSDNISLLTNNVGYITNTVNNLSNYYTIAQIDGKLSGAMHYKGAVETVADLPASGNEQGDMYNVIASGANYAWNGTVWDKLSENIDLSDYQTLITSSNQLSASLISGLAAVATTNNYNDLSNIPAIPTVYDAILTVQKNGVDVDTFSANASANKIINIVVPTTTGELTNNSGFITAADVPQPTYNATSEKITWS